MTMYWFLKSSLTCKRRAGGNFDLRTILWISLAQIGLLSWNFTRPRPLWPWVKTGAIFMDERRRSPRQRRLNGAKIVFNNNASVIECVVRDVSPEGARLLVASPVGIPDFFELRIDRNGNGERHRSKVVWRSHDRIGVIFLDSPC
jgi:PilZ domain